MSALRLAITLREAPRVTQSATRSPTTATRLKARSTAMRRETLMSALTLATKAALERYD